MYIPGPRAKFSERAVRPPVGALSAREVTIFEEVRGVPLQSTTTHLYYCEPGSAMYAELKGHSYFDAYQSHVKRHWRYYR